VSATLQLFDALPPHIEAALRASIERFGVIVPVVTDQAGTRLDGHHRARIAEELGVPYPTVEVFAVDDDARREIARTLNADRRQLTEEQRREVGAVLRGEGHSLRAIGGALGVSHEQVRQDLSTVKELTVPERIVGLDGRSRPSAGQGRLAPLMTSETAEWYTPREVVEAAVAALGAIDLDPCAEPAKGIPAARHFTQAEDGLKRHWLGRVYMNPPYGGVISDWTEKLAAECASGGVSAAVALVPARTDTAWFRNLPATVACFISGRLRFSGHENSAPFPSVALYLGPEPERFRAAFRPLGETWTRDP
jgi:DNA-binding CsgD family transcriptional regulator